MLGDIVHNEQVVRDIERAGIKKIKRLGKGKDKTLLIRAHGTSAVILKRAIGLGYRIVDATCPMVKEIHRIVKKMHQRGYKIIVIGDKKHDEVQGIIGQIRSNAIVIDSPHNIPPAVKSGIKKACIVVQSTQNLENALKIIRILEPYTKELKFFNTVCMPTRMKQEEIKTMPLANDVMIIIGSKTSANTKRLYEIAKSLNNNSYWIQSKEELRPNWFRGAGKVGVTAGASTPKNITQEAISYLKDIV